MRKSRFFYAAYVALSLLGCQIGENADKATPDDINDGNAVTRITSYNVCYTKLLRAGGAGGDESRRVQVPGIPVQEPFEAVPFAHRNNFV